MTVSIRTKQGHTAVEINGCPHDTAELDVLIAKAERDGTEARTRLAALRAARTILAGEAS
ncbi:MAG TPA: hypothetical protein VLI45_09265 [Acidobacteriaceae bacterium]|nr:hypothetical protein [Acidobacteriaceae bacterium]